MRLTTVTNRLLRVVTRHNKTKYRWWIQTSRQWPRGVAWKQNSKSGKRRRHLVGSRI